MIVSGFSHSGTKSAFFCGYNNCTDALWQTITVPTGLTRASATFSLAALTGESSTTSCNDKFYLLLRSSSGTTIGSPMGACNLNTLGAWVPVSIDVSAYLKPYAGQRVTMMFLATTNGTLRSDYFVDDVSLTATSGSIPAAVPATERLGPLHSVAAPHCRINLTKRRVTCGGRSRGRR
jgi:kumamolisin